VQDIPPNSTANSSPSLQDQTRENMVEIHDFVQPALDSEHEADPPADSVRGSGESASDRPLSASPADSPSPSQDSPPITTPERRGAEPSTVPASPAARTLGTHVAAEPALAPMVPEENEEAQPEVNTNRPRTRLQQGIRKPKLYTDGTIRYGLFTSTG